MWRWDNADPSGANVPDEDPDGDGIKFTCNLRFPGQYADRETGTNYNYFRDYDPNIGRYIQSDPIGLRGGANIYVYALSDPIRKTDTYGLYVCGAQGSLSAYFIPDFFIFGPGLLLSIVNFQGACQAHDDCYDNCVTPKSECDDRFYQIMLKQCITATFAIAPCMVVAYSYYEAVNLGGSSVFANARAKCPNGKCKP